MPDITMCMNHSCPMADTCYRNQAKPDKYRQSWSNFNPDDEPECRYYWSMDEQDKEESTDD